MKLPFNPDAPPARNESPYKWIETGGGIRRPHKIPHIDIMKGNMNMPDKQFYNFEFEDYGEAYWVLKKQYR